MMASWHQPTSRPPGYGRYKIAKDAEQQAVRDDRKVHQIGYLGVTRSAR